MKLALVTDAWLPQVNGVVTTLVELVRELQALGHSVEVFYPGQFSTRPCPGYAGIDLAVRPGPALAAYLDRCGPDAIHIATEGPLGWAARRHCQRRGWAFTTAYHTRFPEILKAALRIPLWLGYAVFRHFHGASHGVMVPTQGVLELLERRRFARLKCWTHGVDTELFAYRDQAQTYPPLGDLPRPVSLYVGRISYEKNIEAFLQMDIPGTKVVCGVGPLEANLRARYPQVQWLGVLPRDALAALYASADVFVMSSRSETFGLVMLEAMACGTPVAAYAVDGPLEVIGSPAQGGVTDTDLATAWKTALRIPRAQARARALQFSWAAAAQSFVDNLVPARKVSQVGVNKDGHANVTQLSSDA